MGEIWAGVGGERWHMLEEVCARVEGSAVALATTAWLLDVWALEVERDEVSDRIWRTWRACGEETYEAMRWVNEAAEHAWAEQFEHHPSRVWRGFVRAMLAWSWRVSTQREVPWERVSAEVYDGVEWPGRFMKSMPGEGGANDVAVAQWDLLAGAGEQGVARGHEAGHWVVRARMMRRGGEALHCSGETCQAFMERFLW